MHVSIYTFSRFYRSVLKDLVLHLCDWVVPSKRNSSGSSSDEASSSGMFGLTASCDVKLAIPLVACKSLYLSVYIRTKPLSCTYIYICMYIVSHKSAVEFKQSEWKTGLLQPQLWNKTHDTETWLLEKASDLVCPVNMF